MSHSPIEVTGTGVADAKFTKVTYSVKVTDIGRTGPEAKERVRPTIAKILGVVEQYVDQAGIDRESIKSPLSVDEVTRYDNATSQHIFGGYRASFNITFSGTNVDEASKRHDALTSIDGAQASSPSFEIGASEELERRATELAFRAADRRFRMWCAVLGLSYEDFCISNLSTGHDHGVRSKSAGLEAAMAMEAPMAAPIEIRAGKAERNVTLNVTYARKNGIGA